MPIPVLLTLVGRVSILKVAQFAVQKGLPQAKKKYGDDAAKKAGQWAIKNAKKVVQIKTKTKTIDAKVTPKFHLQRKTGEYVKRKTPKEKIVGRVGKRGTTVKVKEHRIAKVKKTTSTITLGGKTIGKVSSTSQPVRGYKHKPVKGLESKIRHETLGNKIFRLGFKKRFKVKGKKIK